MGDYVNDGGRVTYRPSHPGDREMPLWQACLILLAVCCVLAAIGWALGL